MPISNFDALWLKAAQAWAKRDKEGADNYDAYHSNKLFEQWYGSYGLTAATGKPVFIQQAVNPAMQTGVYALENTGTTEATQTFNMTKMVTTSATFTVQQGISTAITIGVGMFFPDLGLNFHESITQTVSLSESKATSKSEATNWSFSATARVPQESEVPIDTSLTTYTVKGYFSVPLTISGSVAIGMNKRVEGHYIWFKPLSEIWPLLSPAPEGYSLSGNSVSYTAIIDFEGVASADGKTIVGKAHPIGTPSAPDSGAFVVPAIVS